jgi:alanine racemase
MSRAALAILSTENLISNINQIKKNAPKSAVMAMVKANAFGHGLRSTSMRIERHVDNLGVAAIEEAIALRKVGIKCPITLIEGVFEPDELLIASCQKFDVVFHAFEQIKWLQDTKIPLPIKAWIKVDSGMGRLGFAVNDATQALQMLSNSKNIYPEIGLLSHLACADDTNHELNNNQLKIFSDLAKSWQGPKSLANSAAIFSNTQNHFDVIRPGLCLYGASPIKGKSALELGLKPVMTLQTRLTAVRNFPKNSTIGYGATYVCAKDTTIGIIAIGYGDGYSRALPTGTPVLVNNSKCSTIGRISMDMTAIDLTNCPNSKIGDPVILWGEGLPVEDVIKNTNIISHELLSAVQSRVKFNWTLN